MLTERFDDALSFARRLHAAQLRKGSTIPYLAHLLAVAALVLESGGDEDEAIAALLHDAVEDQGGLATRQQIAERFGPIVSAIVDGCTDTDQSPKPPWRERKETFLARLAVASPAVRRVVAADKLHNATAILHDYRQFGESLWSRFSASREETLWYYRQAATILADGDASALAHRLQEVVAEIGRLASEVD